MMSLAQRLHIIEPIRVACEAGARLYRACDVAHISVNDWYRWQQEGQVVDDARPLAKRPEPANKLSDTERKEVIAVCNSERFGSLPPSQIVPILADERRYLASKSTMYRILKANALVFPRGRAAAPRKINKPTTHHATAPNQVWSWDITFLPAQTKGQFYKLYLIEDIFSRYPVGWEVHEEETGELAAELLQRSVTGQRCSMTPLVLHSDNGAPMKSYTLKAKMEELKVSPSHSRPRVSNDNPFSESLFRTLKYWPQWPQAGFASLDQAQRWVQRFIHWYSREHRHSGIQFVTPAQRHQGQDQAILAQRKAVYEIAKAKRPQRWQGATRDWTWISQVSLNPDRDLLPENKLEIEAI
ncbi:putative transposase [Glaciimonas immobilis]|uniref:Putative transposase n=2 Tax=Glaciimonas immobilis TaxID=728004 RepID=A0A840RQ83_9BURK|nr:putative transposase [Glaciimonas immobilis]